tara:strand:+ start:28 stop:729 length:702 start_codon:yes stop_codon:yes gene_type:complete
MISVTVIIPVFNEKNTILTILKKIEKVKKTIESINLEIILINDGSTDGTKKIIEDNSDYLDKIIHLDKNFGKGKAVIEGLKNSNNDYVFFQDADLEYDPEDLEKFVKIVQTKQADIVMGSRFIGNSRSVLHFWHMLGNKFITHLFNLLNNTTFSDIYCCYCLFKKDNLSINNLKSYGWGQQAEILTNLCRNSKKIHEISVNYDARKYSEGKKIKYFHVFEIVYWIVKSKISIN